MNARTRGMLRGAARRVVVLGWLLVVWVMLWGTWSLGTVLAGIIVALAVTLLLPLPQIPIAVHVRPVHLVALIACFLRDLVAASVQVAGLALRPGPPLRSAVLGVRMRTSSDLILMVVTEMVTLVPGSVVIEVSQSEHSLYAHVLDVRGEQDVEDFKRRVHDLEQRVTRAIGTDADLVALTEERAVTTERNEQ